MGGNESSYWNRRWRNFSTGCVKLPSTMIYGTVTHTASAGVAAGIVQVLHGVMEQHKH